MRILMSMFVAGIVFTAACGGKVEGGASGAGAASAVAPAAKASTSAPAAAAPAAKGALRVAGEKAGSHDLAATDAWFIRSGDAYFDIYLTNHAMTSRDAYDPNFALAAGKVFAQIAAQNQDGTAIRPGQTFTFNSSANSRVTAVLRSAAGRETFTIVDDKSLGTLTLSEIGADRVRGEIDVVSGGKILRGAFVAKRLG